MKKTGIVGLSLDKLNGLEGQPLIEQTGGNTGNILFTHGVYSQVTNPDIIGFQFGPKTDLINSEFSSIVIPAANWIDANADWGFLADALEKINIPVCCIGLGSQIPLSRINDIKPGTIRFLKLLARKSALIGVRGEKTAEILSALGIYNTLVCGCPSIYVGLNPLKIPDFPEKDKLTRLSISFTRYTTGDPDMEVQRPIARLAASAASSIVLQSEMIEAKILAGDRDQDQDWLSEYYNIPMTSIDKLYQRLHIFSTQESWINFHKQNTDLTITSRIHGAIASYLAGKPAFVLTHDQRTSELSDTMGIPHISLDSLENMDQILDYDFQHSLYNVKNLNEKNIINLSLIKTLYKTCRIKTCK